MTEREIGRLQEASERNTSDLTSLKDWKPDVEQTLRDHEGQLSDLDDRASSTETKVEALDANFIDLGLFLKVLKWLKSKAAYFLIAAIAALFGALTGEVPEWVTRLLKAMG